MNTSSVKEVSQLGANVPEEKKTQKKRPPSSGKIVAKKKNVARICSEISLEEPQKPKKQPGKPAKTSKKKPLIPASSISESGKSKKEPPVAEKKKGSKSEKKQSPSTTQSPRKLKEKESMVPLITEKVDISALFSLTDESSIRESDFISDSERVESSRERVIKGPSKRKKAKRKSISRTKIHFGDDEEQDHAIDSIPFRDEELITLKEYDAISRMSKSLKKTGKKAEERCLETEDEDDFEGFDEELEIEEEMIFLEQENDEEEPGETLKKMERRKKVQRRRQIDPTTCERDYTIEEVEFMNALDEYKRNSGRMFPTCSEILEVLRGLGYEKTPGPVQISQVPENEIISADFLKSPGSFKDGFSPSSREDSFALLFAQEKGSPVQPQTGPYVPDPEIERSLFLDDAAYSSILAPEKPEEKIPTGEIHEEIVLEEIVQKEILTEESVPLFLIEPPISRFPTSPQGPPATTDYGPSFFV